MSSRNACLLLAVALGGCSQAVDDSREGNRTGLPVDDACASMEASAREPVIKLMAGPLVSSLPWAVVAAPGGGVWFSDGQAMSISHLEKDGTLVEFAAPFPTEYVFEIAVGSDYNVWFENFGLENSRSGWVERIGRMRPDGKVTLFDVPSGNPARRLTHGPDGNIWFTTGETLGMIDPDGQVSERSLGVVLGDITRGPGDTLWFTEPEENRIGRLSLGGELSHFAVPTEESGLTSIAFGPDQNVWFIEEKTGMIGRVTEAGVVTEFPAAAAPGTLRALTSGPDGHLWFTAKSGVLGRISRCGETSAFDLPEVLNSVDLSPAQSMHAVPRAITADARSLWLTAQLEPFETGVIFRVTFED